MAERDDDALWRGPRQEAAQQSGERVEAGAGRWASWAGALGWGGGILARTQQLRVIDHERALVGRADRLLGARSRRAVLRLGGHQRAGAASQGRPAGREFPAQPRGAAVSDQAR